ncbi:MAG: hypothetical protein HQL74_13880 [Magnetococcales bacterium]|nr:hypothetical protein [Magnetococcales bacterium]
MAFPFWLAAGVWKLQHNRTESGTPVLSFGCGLPRYDHYTNYLPLQGRLPQARGVLLASLEQGMLRPESSYKPFFIGRE